MLDDRIGLKGGGKTAIMEMKILLEKGAGRMAGDQKSALHGLRWLLCGILIGAGAILPGVSGGVLAVVFDIYRPFMELLTHPLAAIPKYWKWFIPLGLGWCAGFVGFAKGIAAAIVLSDAVTTWLFIGLIIGTVPALFREAGKEGRHVSSWISLVLCALAVFAALFYIGHVVHAEVEPNFWWYNFCGMLWGMGIVIPGMTSSSIMMALGLYQPMLEGLANLDFLVLAASLPGMVLAILLLARMVTWFFHTHYAIAYHGILGFVLASTLAIIPLKYSSALEIGLSALCCGGGFILAFFLARLEQR